MHRRRFVPQLLAALAVLSCTGLSHAQSFPAKTVRWVVPYPAGGGSDFLARTIGQQLSLQIKQAVVVDNKPGGNTAIAAAEVGRAPADGYTILSSDDGTMVYNTALYSKLIYHPQRDLTPVTLMGKFPMVLAVPQSSPIKDAKAFIAQAKAQPGQIYYGSAGAGSPHHLAMELLKVHAGLQLVHIPYRGAAPALADLVGGQVSGMMVDLAAGAGFIKSGKIRVLAVANPTRLSQLPDVPTFAELGYKDVVAAAQVGVSAPAGTPPAVVDALQKQIAAAIAQPAVRQKLIDFGIEPVGSTPEQYATLIRTEIERWHRVIKEQKISLD